MKGLSGHCWSIGGRLVAAAAREAVRTWLPPGDSTWKRWQVKVPAVAGVYTMLSGAAWPGARLPLHNGAKRR